MKIETSKQGKQGNSGPESRGDPGAPERAGKRTVACSRHPVPANALRNRGLTYPIRAPAARHTLHGLFAADTHTRAKLPPLPELLASRIHGSIRFYDEPGRQDRAAQASDS